ncbi:MAG: hypothetical protein V4440_12215 [Pseudomonadota bacterium]
MPSRAQLETALRNADAAGDHDAAVQLATALKSGQYDDKQSYSQSTTSDVPLVQGMQGYEDQQQSQQRNTIPDPSFLNKVASGLKAGGIMTANAIPSMVGALGGSIYGAASELAGAPTGSGEQYQQKGAEMLSPFSTQDPLANQYMANTAEALSPLAGLPALGGEIGAIGASAKAGLNSASKALQPVTNAISKEAQLLPKSIGDIKGAIGGAIDESNAKAGALLSGRALVPNEKLDLVNKLRSGENDKSLATLDLEVVKPELKGADGKLLPEAYKVVDDKIAKDAIDQGIRDGSVQTIKTSDPYTAKKMLEMTDISEKAKGDDLYMVGNRPGNVIGEEVLSDFNHVKSVNEKAGKKIDAEAKTTLRGKPVDVSAPMSDFVSTLKDELGVEIKQGSDGKMIPVFKNSQIRLSSDKNSRQFIKNIIDDLSNAGEPDAYNVHTFKRAIDNRVVYGESSSALNGTVENAVKKLRNGLDAVLDNNFESYNKANQDYSSTIKALGDFREVAGKKLKFNEPSAAKQIGILSRGVLSNIKAGQNVENAMLNLQSTANKYGGNSKADIKRLVTYSNELDRRFGSHAPTSFAGEVEKSTAKSNADLLSAGASAATGSHHGMIRTAANIKDRLFNTTDKDAYRSLRKLIVKTYTKKEKEAKK